MTNQAVNQGCALIVHSFDGYKDVWGPFFELLFRYWPDCPFKVYLISIKEEYEDPRVTTIKLGEDKKWASNMKRALSRISTPYVIYLQEDYFLKTPVSTERVLDLLGYMKAQQVSYLRLYPSPKPDRSFENDLNLGEISSSAPYRTSTQAAIWNSKVLDALLIEGETGWDFELKGAKRSKKLRGIFLSVREPVIDYPRATGIKKGGWTHEAIVLLEKEGIKIDLSKRPVRPRLTVCLFGIYNRDYSRNRVLIKGLQQNGVKVLECSSRRPGIRKYLDLIKKHSEIRNKYELMIVGFPGFQALILAMFLTRKKIVYDAFFSIYDMAVNDRKTMRRWNPKAIYYWFLDWTGCRLANLILLDTNAHIKYFVKTFRIPESKFKRVFVGTIDNLFYPERIMRHDKVTLVHFHGHFIPLQGVEYIIRAASILKNKPIKFQIIGTGQEYDRIRKLADDLKTSNINWIDGVKYEDLSRYINRADICLGGFGTTQKAKNVSMNKLFEYMACGKPIITGDSVGVREFLDDKSAIFVERGNPEDLAEKLESLSQNVNLQTAIGQQARKYYLEKYTPEVIVKDLLNYLNAEY